MGTLYNNIPGKKPIPDWRPYLWDIYKIGHMNKVDTGIAREMFFAMVALGDADPTLVLDGIEVDWAALKPEWDKMDGGQRTDEKAVLRVFAKDHYKDLTDAFTAGDKDAFLEICAQQMTKVV